MLPAMHCVQPSGNNTIAGPLREGADHAQACHSTTGIGGLQVASVLDGNEVITACRRSGGSGYLVEDEYVYKVQSQLAREEGNFLRACRCGIPGGCFAGWRLKEKFCARKLWSV